jgi:FAD binding domain
MIDRQALQTAAACRHYAMCKIDYLGTGLCPAVESNFYVGYYPEGRMDIYRALAEGAIPVTEGLADIADTCTLCGICDKQCYFVTELRPLKVMKALKDFVEDHRRGNGEIVRVPPDELLLGLRAIVGEAFATNDPAHLAAYAGDPCPIATPVMPRYVALPRTRDEIVQIVKLCTSRDLPYVVRGNGANTMGFANGGGLIIDTNRMRDLVIDRDRWCAVVGPGVSAFDLQREANRQGFRVNVAEPAVLVCANQFSSGIFSLLGASYGTCASNCVNAEFVGPDGNVFELNQADAPNLFAFKKDVVPFPGICTRTWVKLHPMTDDEEGALVPFSRFEEALGLAEELNKRRIGFGIGILGTEYTAAFMAPTKALARRLKEIFPEKLEINYFVLVLGDRFAIEAVRKLTGNRVIDQGLFRTLLLGSPRLAADGLPSLLDDFQSDEPKYDVLCRPEARALIEAALDPSPQTLAEAVDEDMRGFFRGLYERPEMSDLVWLNMFRILSSRMGRDRAFVACIVFAPLDKKDLINAMLARFKDVADSHGVKNGLGFVMPLDLGKRALIEYDYYFDPAVPAEVDAIRAALAETAGFIIETSARVPGVAWIRHLVYQGFSRMEHFLYI